MTSNDHKNPEELQIESNNRLIEELAQKNRKLDESRKRYRSLIDNLPCIVIRFDDRQRIDFVSSAWIEILGGDFNPILGTNLLTLVHSEDRAILTKAIEGSRTAEVRVKNSEGKFHWMRWTSNRVFEGGYQGLLIDLMETRDLEELLRQSQKMEAIGRLSGGVAHNFNNLLTVILTSVERLQGFLPEEAIRSLDESERIKVAANEAASVTRQLLAFSRQQVLKSAKCNLVDLVKEGVWLLSDVVATPQVSFEYIRDSEEELPVIVDKVQFHQVLLNLAINAKDAIEGCGEIVIRTKKVELGIHEASDLGLDFGEYASVSVVDNGAGIDELNLEKIFEPFFSTKDIDEGIGFGLATCYGTIKQSGGSIRVKSELGKGSDFEILLPLDADASKGRDSEPEKKEKPKIREAKILMVEDEPAILEIACEALREENHHVDGAATVSLAIDFINCGKVEYDLVVTDVVMPDGGGRKLLNYLDSQHITPKVIVVSGYDTDFLGDDLSCTSFLQKPFSILDLIEEVRSVLADD